MVAKSRDARNVLVTAIGGAGPGEQVLKALNLADDGRYRVFGTDVRPDCPQASWVQQFAVVPPARDDLYLSTVVQLCDRWGIDALLPCSEQEIVLISGAREQFEGIGVRVVANPSRVLEVCLDKRKTAEVLAMSGFLPPTTYSIRQRADLGRIDQFPVVIKPALHGGGSKDVYIAQGPQQLESVWEYLVGDDETGLVVQEYVGTPENEFSVGVLTDMHGSYVNAIALKRDLTRALSVRQSVENRTSRAELGPRLVVSSGISQGRLGRYPEVTEQCRRIAEAVGSRGPLNIQCRLDGDRVRVFEINPRFSGTTAMRALAGFNEPRVLLDQLLFGEPPRVGFAYWEGQILRGIVDYQVL